MPSHFLSDFPDRLSPMLVKELRQGMRARGFIGLFLLFQGLLAFILLTAESAFTSSDGGPFVSGVIFAVFSIAVLIIQPMRGATALSSEITSNTIEMMVLTRLSAWRIVFGKWIAIVSQSALLLVTIIPYLILRYFFGGMVLLGELVLLGLIFLSSVSFTAVMVGFSSSNAKFARILPVLFIVMGAQALPAVFIGRRMFGASFDMTFFTLATTEARVAVLAYLCLIAYLGWSALSYGTSTIAPVAENHATPRRLVALALGLIALGMGFFEWMHPYVLTFIFAIIFVPVAVMSWTEASIPLKPLWAAFEKRGLPGRIASVFLLPGWPAGAIFTVLLIALATAGISISSHRSQEFYDPEPMIVALGLLGGLLLPALLSMLFTRQEGKRFTVFLLFTLGSAILTIGPAILTEVYHVEKLLWGLIWNPPVALALLSDSPRYATSILTVVTLVDALLIAAILAVACRGLHQSARVVAESEPAATGS